jgi:protocatechuate 3,4-dioxygenase beta subunit
MNQALFTIAVTLGLLGASLAGEHDSPAPLLSVSGIVVGPDGRPAAGAAVYLREWAYLRLRLPVQPTATTDILATTTTDRQGRFTFRNVAPKSPAISEPGGPLAAPWDVIAAARGFGIASERLQPKSPHPDVLLKLAPEARLQGRLLDPEGKPAPGVRVQVVAIQALNRPARIAYHSAGYLSLHGSQVPLMAQTDTDGRFVLPGIPANRRLALMLQDDRFARQIIYAATADQAQADVVVGRAVTATGSVTMLRQPVFTGAFSFTLQPAHRLHVRVTLEDTGKPAAGAVLRDMDGPSPFPAATTADVDGCLALGQLATGRYLLAIAAPDQSDYLGKLVQIDVPADKGALELSVPLPAGMIVSGQVIDEDTGKGISDVLLAYQAPAANVGPGQTLASPHPTGPDGNFRMAVPPKQGWLRIAAPVTGYVTTDLSNPAVRNKEGPLVRRVDTATGKLLPPVKFMLNKGTVITMLIKDQDGKPVPGALVSGHGLPSDADGKVTLSGLDPRQRHELVVVHPNRPLSARIAVPPSLDRTVVHQEVRLQLTGSVTGRVVDEANRPITMASVQIVQWSPFMKGDKKLYNTTQLAAIACDSQGKFFQDHLPAGFSYSVSVTAPGLTSAKGFPLEMKPGSVETFPDAVLCRLDQSIAGVLLDPFGNPIPAVRIMGTYAFGEETESGFRTSGTAQAQTDKDGHFRLTELPRGLIRLAAVRFSGNIAEIGAQPPASFQAWSGDQHVKMILAEARGTNAAAALTGKPAPEFPVRKWLNRPGDAAEHGFQVKDFGGKLLVLAFLDEARPSQRLLPQLHKLHAQRNGEGLVIVRVYEQPGYAEDLAKISPLPAALITPGLLPGGFSEAFQKYGIRAAPSLFLIDRQGTLRVADVELDALAARIDELLRK